MRKAWLATSIALAACATPPAPSTDAATDAPSATCTSAADCDDGLFCNGAEACMPGGVGSNRFGCVAGTSTCLTGQTCNESTNTCTTVCGMTGDADGDGHDAIHCGGDDCDDSDAHRFPGNPEVCDATSHDEDCDPTTHGARDTDGDGHDDSACCNVDASGTHLCGDDCDDMHAAVHPGAPEICNGIDDDCNGLLDGPSEDSDHDGHANDLCAGAGGSDCNDRYPDVYDGAPELCDGIDSNCSSCDATTQLCTGAGCATPTTRCGDPGSDTTEDADGDAHAPTGATCSGGFPADDCDDAHAAAHPGGTEICDGLDDDCNGTVDDAATVIPACRASASGLTAAGMGCDSVGATCVVLQCAPGSADCDADPSNGCEVTLATDVLNCGACGVSCGPGGVCAGGLCDAIVGLGVGRSDTCAVRESGALLCWGLNNHQQLADGTSLSRTQPMLATELADVTAVFPGYVASCARTRAGTFQCAGTTYGVDLSSLSILDIGVSRDFDTICYVQRDHTVWCWGNDALDQLGDGTHTFSATPVQVPGIGDAARVAVGGSFACALHQSGGLTCWGDSWDLPAPAPPVTGVPASITQLEAGGSLLCALAGGIVTCFGGDAYGERGDGPGDAPWYAGVAVPLPRPAIDIGVGSHHACAILDDGEAWCWGANDDAELGDGTTTQRDAPVNALGHLQFVEIAAGPTHTCARTRTGSIVCWGANLNGQLGTGDIVSRRVPSERAGIGVPHVSQGNFRGCVRMPDGSIGCTDPDGTSAVVDLIGTGFTDIDARSGSGARHTCAVRADGTGWCWGANESGQLGDGTTTDSTTPVRFGSFTDLVQLAPAGSATCGLRATGEIDCVGNNDAGVLGDGTTTSRTTLAPVSGIADAVEIASGTTAMCARQASGTLSCWGANGRGALGDGTHTSHYVPVGVSGLADAAQITGGLGGFCARRTNGQVLCWGRGELGQIGDGATMDRATPTPVQGLPPVVDVDAGGLAHCATTRVGAVWCWGNNDYGEVGDGTTTLRLLPVAIGIDDAVRVATGALTSCVSRASGAVFCWGADEGGQVGSGILTTAIVSPTAMRGP